METSKQYEYYKEMTKSFIKVSIGSDGKICNDNIQQAFIDLIAEMNLEHKHNINNITYEDVYLSHMKKKKAKKSRIRYIMSRMSTQIK